MIQPCLAAVLVVHDASLILDNQGNFYMRFDNSLKNEKLDIPFSLRESPAYICCAGSKLVCISAPSCVVVHVC